MTGTAYRLLAVLVLVGTTLPPLAAAHNFHDVYSHVEVTFTDDGGIVTAEVAHCDGIFNDPGFCAEEDADRFDGFGYTDGRPPLIHVACTYDLDGPRTAVDLSATITGGDGVTRSVCERTVEAGASLETTVDGNAALPPIEERARTETVLAEAKIDGETAASASWSQAWIEDAPARQVAKITDPSGSDIYRRITGNATTYVVDDPRGDGQLFVGESPTPVFDGIPVLVGDLLILREDVRGEAHDGKRWTITSTIDESFLAQIRPTDEGRATRILAYHI